MDSTLNPPLADRLRPRNITEVVGQDHLLAAGKPLRVALETGRIHSLVFWGPPGTGKTTLAKLAAQHGHAQFLTISAVLSGVKEIRAAIEQAQLARAEHQQATILFVDEVHRFNKSQQDAFLPYVENGTFTFIGATTENPSFELNNALLSRVRVYVLKSLIPVDIRKIIDRALADYLPHIGMEPSLRDLLAESVDGDARRALNLLEIITDLADQQVVDQALVLQVLSSGQMRRFDKGGEAFYDQISALHKSVRGSAPDAALYWLARMLDGGCDPLYIARRVVRMACEDVGNADPRGIEIAISAWDTQARLGSPEGELAIAQAVVYIACAAKSNAVYKAFSLAKQDAQQHGSLEVPMYLRNAPTSLMKNLNYGEGYRYAHDEPEAYAAGENYFPEQLKGQRYYHPVNRGLEIKIAEKLKYLQNLDRQAKSR